MVLDFDLNYPLVEGSSASILPQVSSAESNSEKFGSIDVHLLDDDIQLLTSPPPFFQCRRRFRKNHQPTTNLEAYSERLPAEQGTVVAESASILLSFNGGHNDAWAYSNQQPYANLTPFNSGDNRIEENINYVLPTPPMSAPPPLASPPRTPMSAPPPLASPPRTPMSTPPPLSTDATFRCPICLDVISNPCSTVCGHIFCEECIQASIKASVKQKKGRLCPNCRTKLPSRKSFHRVYFPRMN